MLTWEGSWLELQDLFIFLPRYLHCFLDGDGWETKGHVDFMWTEGLHFTIAVLHKLWSGVILIWVKTNPAKSCACLTWIMDKYVINPANLVAAQRLALAWGTEQCRRGHSCLFLWQVHFMMDKMLVEVSMNLFNSRVKFSEPLREVSFARGLFNDGTTYSSHV